MKMKNLINANDELLKKILDTARKDDRIRMVVMTGSRVNPASEVDPLSDFDIIYFVRDLHSFTGNDQWIAQTFGPILIMQKPDDWFTHPYDFSGNDPFTYLVRFLNGTRMDLTLMDVDNIPKRIVDGDWDLGEILLKKEDMQFFEWKSDPDRFLVKKPAIKEYEDTFNEFLWLATYVAKGIRRRQFLYVKVIREQYQAEMLINMISWSAAIDFNFEISTGKFHHLLPRYLPPSTWHELEACLTSSNLDDAFQNELKMMHLFEIHSSKVALSLGLPFDKEQFLKVREYLIEMQNDANELPL